MLHLHQALLVLITCFRLPGSLAFTVTRLSHHHAIGSISSSSRLATLDQESEVDFRTNTIKPTTNPLAPHTFAGQVEQAIIQKFGEESTQRVLESWRLLDLGYEHRQRVEDASSKHDEAAIDPESSFCYQYAHSYVPGLTCQPFWDTNENRFQWAKKLEQSYKVIRKEFQSVCKDMDRLQQEGNNVWAGALTEEAGGYGLGWKTLVLMDRGMWDPTNCNLFPKTAKAVDKCGIPCVEVFFASMEANSNILMHSDFTNFVLTSHLAVDIPYSGENKCRLTVGDTTKQWENGNVMLFDTSIMHDAINESDKTRYILMFRLWHPDLTDTERNALQYIYDCLEEPLLLSTNEEERALAEKRIDSMRTFPKLTNGSGSGFGGGGKQQKKNSKKRR